MPVLMTKAELAEAAKTLAASFDLVQSQALTYIPVDWETGAVSPPPAIGQRIWMPFSKEDKIRLANSQHNILFASDSEFRNFDFMLRQVAARHENDISGVLIKTRQGLKLLNEEGKLVAHEGKFTPNYVKPILNEDPDDIEHVFRTIVEWVGGEEATAESLLYHLATCLAPHYSAVKYVILLGEGRNGKSVLLSMLAELFGDENVSNITRQMMAERSPSCVELNNKLVNIIFDGEMGYIKDSSMEKTLIAGEPGSVRMLYESGTTRVQTNALFIEALNREPKARDKSSALQKRLVRFQFPNVYPQDKQFAKTMTSERYLGALLALLIKYYVREDQLAEALKLTEASLELQLEQVYLGSPILQYLGHLLSSDPDTVTRLEKGEITTDAFMNSFKPWAETQRLADRSDADILELMKAAFIIKWSSVRVNGVPKSVRKISSMRDETLFALNQLKGDGAGVDNTGEELVGD